MSASGDNLIAPAPNAQPLANTGLAIDYGRRIVFALFAVYERLTHAALDVLEGILRQDSLHRYSR